MDSECVVENSLLFSLLFCRSREFRADKPAAVPRFVMSDPFAAGSVVIVTLNMPREKFWGVVLALTPAGASLRGVDLNSIDDFARQVRAGEQVSANIVFFPMHRIERVEIDARNGEIPSLQERFELKAGRAFAEVVE